MSYQDILYEVDDHVARVTLNQPARHNPVYPGLVGELDHAFEAAAADPNVRVIVLRAVGEHFSAGHGPGADATEPRPHDRSLRERYNWTASGEMERFLRWRDIPKPTIASVQGYCIFAGWMIAAPMDLIFAAEDARFLAALMNYFSPPWELGIRKAKENLFESRFLSGVEARDVGLVNRVFPREQLDERTMAYAHRVAKNDPFVMRMTKLACNQAQDAQGFSHAIKEAAAFFILGSSASTDPEAVTIETKGHRHPMVQRAFDNLKEDAAQ